MASVPITGSGTQSVSMTFDTAANYALAQTIAAQINSGVAGGSIVTTTEDTPPPLPSGVGSGAYIQTVAGLVSLAPGYTSDNINIAGSGNAVVFSNSGASGQRILTDENTNLTFNASGGSGTVVAGGGSNTLHVNGPGNWSLNTGGGNDAVYDLGTGKTTIAAGGGTNSIQLGSGKDWVTSTGVDNIQAGSGDVTVDATAAGSDYYQGGSGNLLFVGDSGGATIIGGSGSDTFWGGSGTQVVHGGKAGNNDLEAGSGAAATLVGGGAGDRLYARGSTDQVLIAGSGNETLSATFSYGNDSLTAGSGNDSIYGGTGADTFIGGTGHATISADPNSSNVFAFIQSQAGGTDVVTGFTNASAPDIQIHLQGYASTEAATALAAQVVSGGSVSVTLSDHTSITFQDVTHLSNSNFV